MLYSQPIYIFIGFDWILLCTYMSRSGDKRVESTKTPYHIPPGRSKGIYINFYDYKRTCHVTYYTFIAAGRVIKLLVKILKTAHTLEATTTKYIKHIEKTMPSDFLHFHVRFIVFILHYCVGGRVVDIIV